MVGAYYRSGKPVHSLDLLEAEFSPVSSPFFHAETSCGILLGRLGGTIMRLVLRAAAVTGLFCLAAGDVVGAPGGGGSVVALPRSAFETGLHFCSREGPAGLSGFWQVPAAEAANIDGQLLRKLRDPRLRGQLGADPTAYTRQYVGLVRKGRRYVYVNASMRRPANWRTQLIVVCDDGASSWGIEYDPRSTSFSDLKTNAAFDRDPLEGLKL
jgi:hypothetical protein